MRLSQNFTLQEFTRSQTALRNGIDNTPTVKGIEKLKVLVNTCIQPARNFSGPLLITSGYRCKELNAKIGGSNSSQHSKCEAADLEAQDNARLFTFLRNNTDFDQLIWEFGDDNQPEWVHVSCKASGNRGEVLKSKRVEEKKGKKTTTEVVYEKY